MPASTKYQTTYVAKKRKPMLISTGMASLEEITEALITAKDNGADSILLFHCISSYPAPAEEANLKQIINLKDKFEVLVGLSDHTIGNTCSISAISLGACAIEKHFTINRKDKGPDSAFSAEPNELSDLVRETNIAWKALGVKSFKRPKVESDNLIFRRSLYYINDIKAGEKIKEKDIRRIRPGFGISPKHYKEIIGKTILKDVERGQAIKWSDFI